MANTSSTPLLRMIGLWLVPIYFITLTLTIRNYIGPMVPLGQVFPEWTSVFIYLSDIAFIPFFIVFLLLIGKKRILPVKVGLIRWLIIIFFAVQILRLATDVSVNVPRGTLLLYRLFQAISLAYLVYEFKAWKQFKRIVLISVISITSILAIIGIIQFFHNESLGLHLFGESVLNIDMMNVAKVGIANPARGSDALEINIRAYSLLQHPNILAFVLSVGIVALGILLKTWHLSEGDSLAWYRVLSVLGIISITLLTIGVLLTFSRAGYLMLAIALGVLLNNIRKNVPRGTFWSVFIILLAIIVLFGWFYGSAVIGRLSDSLDNATDGGSVRLGGIRMGWNEFRSNWLFGVGMGNEVSYSSIADTSHPAWFYQPTHNVFLLVLAESGVVSILLIASVILVYKKMFHVEQYRNRVYSGYKNLNRNLISADSILMGILLILPLLFDHYIWTTVVGMGYWTILFALCSYIAIKE